MAEYETSVTLHQRYNYAASSSMREELVTQMNSVIDGLYETRYEELYHQNAYREVTGRQVSMPPSELPEDRTSMSCCLIAALTRRSVESVT